MHVKVKQRMFKILCQQTTMALDDYPVVPQRVPQAVRAWNSNFALGFPSNSGGGLNERLIRILGYESPAFIAYPFLLF